MAKLNVSPAAPEWATAAVSPLPTIALVEEVAGVLRVHPRTVRRLIERGQLRALRAREAGSSRVMIPRSAVASYLASLAGAA